jgi:tetratricopeptide (TPR) repeat protein
MKCFVMVLIMVCGLVAGCGPGTDGIVMIKGKAPHITIEEDSSGPPPLPDYDPALALPKHDEKTQKELDAYMTSAETKYRENHLAAAAEDLEKAIKIDSTNAAAYTGRAMVRYAMKNINGSIADCNRALALAPDNYLAFYCRGLGKDAIGNKAGADVDFERAIGLGINDPRPYCAMGKHMIKAGQYNAAITYCDSGLAVAPGNEDLLECRALAKMNINDLTGAIDDINEELKRDPKDDEAQSLKKVLEKMKRTGK